MVFIALLNGAPLASASSARAVSSNRFDCAGSSGWLALSGVASSAPEAASHEPVVHPAGLPLVPSSTGGSEPLGMKRRVLQLSSSADVTVDRFDAAMSDQDDDTIRIYDDDFTYDAHFEISGDFAPGEKWPYALEIVELLNAGFEVLARPPAAPETVRLTDAHLGNAGEPCDLTNVWIQLADLTDCRLLCAFAEARGAGEKNLEK